MRGQIRYLVIVWSDVEKRVLLQTTATLEEARNLWRVDKSKKIARIVE